MAGKGRIQSASLENENYTQPSPILHIHVCEVGKVKLPHLPHSPRQHPPHNLPMLDRAFFLLSPP